MADNNESTDDILTQWVQANMGESFTQAFNIRKVMYRIQDVDLPFKRGIRVEQFLMFLGAFVVTFIVNNLLIYPIFRLIGLSLPVTFHLILWLVFPIFMAVRIGKPMPHQKTITGMASSFIRYSLDDRWHCRGLPMRAAPTTGLEGNYLRTWTVDPAYAGVEAPSDLPASEFVIYSNMDLPDGAVRLPGEVIEKKGILEDEDAFLDRLTARSNIGSTTEVVTSEQVSTFAGDNSDYVIIEETAPVFDRDALSRN